MINYPITANYVANWGLKEAVREIMQNALDAGGLEVFYAENSTIIMNEGSFNRDALLLGNSIKAEGSIGKYGEGMKLAMLVLARLGIDHSVKSGYYCYRGTFTDSGFSQPTFSISCEALESPIDITLFRINADLKDLITEVYKPQDEGIVDKDLYVQGLLVCDLPGFKYGYNMPKGTIELDRDRRNVDTSIVEGYAAKLVLNNLTYDALAKMLFDNMRDVNRLFCFTTSSQDKEIGKACAKLVEGQRISYSYIGDSSLKVGYHFYNFAVTHGGAQKPYSANAQKLADIITKHKNKLRRDVREDLLKLVEEL